MKKHFVIFASFGLSAVALALLLWGVKAYAASSFIGVAEQDVRISSAGVSVPISFGAGVSLPAGTNNIGDVDVLSLPSIPTGTNRIGDVGVKDSGGQELDVKTNGSIDVNVISTQSLKGQDGNVVTTGVRGSTVALHVLNVSQPDLSLKSFVYVSSDNAVATSTTTLTGLGKEISLMAFNGDCRFKINGGQNIDVGKNTSESFDLFYTLTNPAVLLDSKDPSAICKVRITGVN